MAKELKELEIKSRAEFDAPSLSKLPLGIVEEATATLAQAQQRVERIGDDGESVQALSAVAAALFHLGKREQACTILAEGFWCK